jgi:hypothetical protein
MDPTEPIRVELGTVEADGVVWGEIVNLASPVTASDGSCLPALADLGAENPLTSSGDPGIWMHRHVNMHGGYDNVMLLGWPSDNSNMATGLYAHPGLLIGAGSRELLFESAPHGTPTAGPWVTLQEVVGGGEPCPD